MDKVGLDDYLASGGSIDILLAQATATINSNSQVPTDDTQDHGLIDVFRRSNAALLSTVLPERIDWLSKGWIAAAKLHIFDGDPGLGKSTLMTEVAARLTRGQAMLPGTPQPMRPRGVILISYEDGLRDTIRPRFEAAGCDLEKILVLNTIVGDDGSERTLTIPDDLAIIADAIEQVDAGMIIVDPLMAAFGTETDAHRDQDVRRAFAPLTRLAEEKGVAVVLVRHLNKTAGNIALYRGGGSIGIIGAARLGMLAAFDPEEQGVVILATTKSNIGRKPQSLRFRLVSDSTTRVARVEWLGTSSLTADDLLNWPIERGKRAVSQNAKKWLENLLADGPVKSSMVIEMAKRAGIAERTLKRAKSSAGVQSRKEGFGKGAEWLWYLPNHAMDSEDSDLAPFVKSEDRFDECEPTDLEEGQSPDESGRMRQ